MYLPETLSPADQLKSTLQTLPEIVVRVAGPPAACCQAPHCSGRHPQLSVLSVFLPLRALRDTGRWPLGSSLGSRPGGDDAQRHWLGPGAALVGTPAPYQGTLTGSPP